MSDLVKQLRHRAKTRNTGMVVATEDTETMGYYSVGSAQTDNAAADRIEALEAALRMIVDKSYPEPATTVAWAQAVAAAALAPEQNK